VLLMGGVAGGWPAFAAAAVPEQATQESSVSGGQGTCATCHADIAKQLAAAPHSRGARQIQCNDCHKPHGDQPGKVSRSVAEQNATCTRCHRAMAGPFAYEHPPVKIEGCASCHAAHGNSDANDLILGGAPAVCLQCHAISQASVHPHDISAAGLVCNWSGQYVPCTDCHSHIHGSNLSNALFK
jgi:DmsE family decaheme c-type cytochrome